MQILLVAGCTYLLASFDWRPAPVTSEPLAVANVAISGPLRAGTAQVPIEPKLPVVKAGYPPPRPMARSEHDPLEIRALVISGEGGSLALVLADMLFIPEPMIARLRERVTDLHLGAVIATATHTHSSLGGYDTRPLAQLAGTGRYDPAIEAHLLAQMEAAVRRAATALQPVDLSVGRSTLSTVTNIRDIPDGRIDDVLSLVQLKGTAPVASIVVFAEHPTTFPKDVPELSGDVPSEVMRRLEKGSGAFFLLQGAVGDATITEPPDPQVAREENAVAGIVKAVSALTLSLGNTAPAVSYVEMEVGLPPPSADAAVPGPLRRPAANLLGFTAQRTAHVGVLRVGPAVFLLTPGEPTEAAAEALQRRIAVHLPPETPLRVVGLAEGYLGYIESPERVRDHLGEAKRTYYGPQLVGRLADGFIAAVALMNSRSAATTPTK